MVGMASMSGTDIILAAVAEMSRGYPLLLSENMAVEMVEST